MIHRSTPICLASHDMYTVLAVIQSLEIIMLPVVSAVTLYQAEGILFERDRCCVLTGRRRLTTTHFVTSPSDFLERQILCHSSSPLCTSPSMSWTSEIYETRQTEWSGWFSGALQDRTQSIDAFVRYGYWAFEFRCVNIAVLPWAGRLRSIRSISAQEWGISFAKQPIETSRQSYRSTYLNAIRFFDIFFQFIQGDRGLTKQCRRFSRTGSAIEYWLRSICRAWSVREILRLVQVQGHSRFPQ